MRRKKQHIFTHVNALTKQKKNHPPLQLRLTSCQLRPRIYSTFQLDIKYIINYKYVNIPCIAINQILVPCTFLFFSILRGMRAMILPFFPHHFLISPSFPLLCSSFSSQVRHPCIGETVGHLKTRLRRQIPGQMIQSFPSNPKFPNCSGWLKLHDSWHPQKLLLPSVLWM